MRTHKQAISSKTIFVPQLLYSKACISWEKRYSKDMVREPLYLHILFRNDKEKRESIWLRRMLENLDDKTSPEIWITY